MTAVLGDLPPSLDLGRTAMLVVRDRGGAIAPVELDADAFPVAFVVVDTARPRPSIVFVEEPVCDVVAGDCLVVHGHVGAGTRALVLGIVEVEEEALVTAVALAVLGP